MSNFFDAFELTLSGGSKKHSGLQSCQLQVFRPRPPLVLCIYPCTKQLHQFSTVVVIFPELCCKLDSRAENTVLRSTLQLSQVLYSRAE